MNGYRLIIAYDGTEYFGWQAQNHSLAIQQVLQDSFYTVFKKKIVLHGTSRTDAGVHALGQVASFTSDISIDPERMLQAWNTLLPPDIVIRSISLVPPTFNPYRSVKQKIYWYHFFQKRPLPFVQRYGWYYRHPVDQEKLHDCLQVFVGTHDFRSFCTGHDMKDGTIRTIDKAFLTYLSRYAAYRVTIQGERFMRYMVRRIVGACLHVAAHPTLQPDDLQTALLQKNPQQLLPNAPAKGLTLYKIVSL